MRIALTTSLVSPILEAEANGPHAIVVDLARGLAGRGHDVAIVCAAGSVASGVRLVEIDVETSAAGAAIRSDGSVEPEASAALARGFAAMFREIRAREFDVISQHAFDAPAFELGRGLPVVHTLHLPPIDQGVTRAARSAQRPMVAVSEASARNWAAAGVEGLTVIRNGVPEIDVSREPIEGFALVAGRISPEKGTAVAIRVARRAGLAVRVVGDIYDRTYFEREVAPLLADGELTAAMPRARLRHVMARAAVTLMPIGWEETFGLVAAEAQMAGCPVVAYARGALPEIVVDGITGILVKPDDEDGLVAAVGRARQLDRGQIAASARARLGVEPMIAAYDALLTSVAARVAAA